MALAESVARTEGLVLEQAGAYRTSNGLSMVGVGIRGALPSLGGFTLAVKFDAFLVRMASDAVAGRKSGNLAAVAAGVSRVRAALEDSRELRLNRRILRVRTVTSRPPWRMVALVGRMRTCGPADATASATAGPPSNKRRPRRTAARRERKAAGCREHATNLGDEVEKVEPAEKRDRIRQPNHAASAATTPAIAPEGRREPSLGFDRREVDLPPRARNRLAQRRELCGSISLTAWSPAPAGRTR